MKKLILPLAAVMGLMVGFLAGIILSIFITILTPVENDREWVYEGAKICMFFCTLLGGAIFASFAHAVNMIIEAICDEQVLQDEQ